MTTTSHLNNAHTIIGRHTIVDVWCNTFTHHHSLYAAVAFIKGDTIIDFYAACTQNYPTYQTVQIANNSHIILEPAFLQYVNHSCDPNVFFDITAMQLVCIKSIQPGEELCFFYPSAEWEMARPFICNCGSDNCLQFISGAAHLETEMLGKYRLTEFILQQVK